MVALRLHPELLARLDRAVARRRARPVERGDRKVSRTGLIEELLGAGLEREEAGGSASAPGVDLLDELARVRARFGRR